MFLKLHNTRRLFFLLLLSLRPLAGWSADSYPLFDSDSVFKIEIRADFSSIQVDRSSVKPVYHDATLTYQLRGQNEVVLSVRIMARGNFRRDTSHCSFPPLFVNFRKEEVKNTLFENQDRIKLVTPCQDDEDVIDEYLVYKMYNRVTDASFRVRLVKILFFDTGSQKEIFEKYSFFLEDNDHMAERNNGKEIDRFITPFELDRDSFNKMALFQFMIGNKDWYISSRQNINLVQPVDNQKMTIPVPYDFDLSGFVNAEYTKPKGVPEKYLASRRVYKGICLSMQEYKVLFSYFRKMRPEFENIIKTDPIISKGERNYLLNYIAYFYTVIGNKDLTEKEILSVCETKKTYNIPE